MPTQAFSQRLMEAPPYKYSPTEQQPPAPENPRTDISLPTLKLNVTLDALLAHLSPTERNSPTKPLSSNEKWAPKTALSRALSEPSVARFLVTLTEPPVSRSLRTKIDSPTANDRVHEALPETTESEPTEIRLLTWIFPTIDRAAEPTTSLDTDTPHPILPADETDNRSPTAIDPWDDRSDPIRQELHTVAAEPKLVSPSTESTLPELSGPLTDMSQPNAER